MATRITYEELADTLTDLTVPFPYISKDHVEVWIREHSDGLDQAVFGGSQLEAGIDYTWASANVIQLTTAADGLKDYLVRRRTPTTPVTEQQPGVFSSDKVNLADRQARYIGEEALDNSDDWGSDIEVLFGRALRLPPGETTNALPAAADRAGKFPFFANSTGAVTLIDGLPNTDTTALQAMLASASPGNGASLVKLEDGRTVQVALGIYNTVAEIKALPVGTAGARVYLSATGRSGTFVWLTSNQSSLVTKDTQNGVVIAADASPTGASGCWVRENALITGIWYGGWFGISRSSADNSAAFTGLQKAISARIQTSSSGLTSNRIGLASVILPAGELYVKTPKAVLDSANWSGRTIGLCYSGVDANNTIIVYEPTTAGDMIYNNDNLLFLTFKNMGFMGKNADDASGASNWMYSYNNNGGAQGLIVENVRFGGKWLKGTYLEGINNNSEHSYLNVFWSGCDHEDWLYSPTTSGGGSDQFLNYWFTACRYWSCTGRWINLKSGGHVHINNCDVSDWAPTVDKHLIRFDQATHAYGITTLRIKGLRTEQKTDYAHVLYCRWEQGIIEVEGLDCSSQHFNEGGTIDPDAEHIYIEYSASIIAPQVSFKSCRFMGKMRVVTSVGAFSEPVVLSLENCELMTVDRPDKFFIFDGASGNLGSLPVVRGRACRCLGAGTGVQVVSDWDLNWRGNAHSAEVKVAFFTQPTGKVSGGSGASLTSTIRLNKGALVLRVGLVKSVDSVTEALPIDINIDADTTPIVDFTTPGNHSEAYSLLESPNVELTTGDMCDLVLTTTAGQTSPSALHFIEYI